MRWNQEQVIFLKNYYPNNGLRFCCEYLGLTINQVRKKIEILKLVRIKEKAQNIKEYHQKYYLINKKSILETQKKYTQNNKEKISSRKSLCANKQRKNNPKFKLAENLRRRIHHAVKDGYKSDSTLKLLGCSIEYAKTHLESQFKPGMSWGNHGRYGWHIDHIKPISSFDLTIPEQQKVCFHYTNLQPLWATTNIARENGDFDSVGNINKGNHIIIC